MLTRNFTFKITSELIVAVMAFVSLTVMTRFVGSEYGMMMWGLAFVAMINSVADLGFNSTNLKFVSKKGHDQSSCYSTYLTIKIFLTVIMVIIALVTTTLMFINGNISDEQRMVCVTFMAYYIILNVQHSIYYTLDGRLETDKTASITLVECFIRNSLLIVFAIMTVDVVKLSSAYVIASVVSLSFSIFLLWKSGLKLKKPAYIKEYVVFAIPLAISLALTTIMMYLDKVLIGLFYDSVEVAYYTASAGVITTFTTIGVSINNIILPHLSKTGIEKVETQNVIWMIEKHVCLLLIPILMFILVFGKEVACILFGSDFESSGNMMSIQSIEVIAFILCGLMTQVLFAINKTRMYLKATVIFAVISIIGFFILIPEYGLGLKGVGASISITIGYLIYAVILVYYVWKVVGIKLYPGLIKLVIGALICVGYMFMLNAAFHLSSFIELAIAGITCEVLFLVVMYLMKVYTVDELKSIKDDFLNKNE